jgi:hypothetical protein
MKKMMLFLAVLFLSASATSAFAVNRCVRNGFGQLFEFDTVKLTKNKTAPLAGRFHFGGDSDNNPAFGAATLDSDGSTVRIFVMTFGSGAQVTWLMTGDKFLNATGTFDTAPLAGSDGADSWTSIPCTSPFPPAFPSRAVARNAPGNVE